MITTRLLTKDAFLACFAAPMQDVTADANAIVDIWSYVDALALPLGRADEIRDVTSVYRGADGLFDQVLIDTDATDFFLAVVVDRRSRCVLGHYPLDLKAEYGRS